MAKYIEKCLLCQNESFLPFYSLGAPNRIEVHNRVCTRCGLVLQSPRSDYEELKEYYESYVEMSQPEIADIPYSFEDHLLGIARLRLKYLKQFVSEGDKILDIGCSIGAVLKVLRDESGLELETVGVNPEQSVSEFGRREYGLDVRGGMFERQNFASDSFDFVILDNVLEHFDEPRKAIREIHALVSETGKIFIATNNLDQPHGFLWQNFFSDHTVTFSPRTLKCLLEVEGFAIIDQDFTGHTTYEGYHYPYQYAVARKAKVPESYDFESNGDEAQAKIEQAKKYIELYYSIDGYAKQSYELNLKKNKSPSEKLKALKYSFLSKISGQDTKFQIRNHTLPPEEYYLRRALIAECKTDGDVNLAVKLAEKSGLTQEGPIILRTSGSSGKIKLHTYPTSFLKEQLPSTFKNSNDFLNNLINKSLPIGELLYIKLENADLREDVIKDTYKIFRERDVDYAFVDFSMFSNASWEFVRNDRLKGFSLNQAPVNKSRFFTDNDFDKLIWPGKEDYYYYFKEKFEQYYPIPKTVSLDLSPTCNKKCDKCQFHSPRSPYKHLLSNNQFMDVNVARKILDEASQWNPKPTLVPTFSGEPLLYPSFEEVLSYADKLGFRISVTTNGALLTEKKSRYLIDLGIEALVASIDAYEEETYEMLQAPGGLAKVRDNLLRFLEMRGGRKKPVVGVHFLMEKRNQNEFEKFLNYWSGKVDFVSRAIHQDQFSDNRCTLPLWLPLQKRRACWSAWTCLYIRWNGDVSFCGFDIGSDSSDLNVEDKTLSEIWNSEDFWRWRDAQLETDYSVLYCKACPDWAGNRTVIINDDRWKIQRTPLSETYYLKKGK